VSNEEVTVNLFWVGVLGVTAPVCGVLLVLLYRWLFHALDHYK
jgi:hypothetical protein